MMTIVLRFLQLLPHIGHNHCIVITMKFVFLLAVCCLGSLIAATPPPRPAEFRSVEELHDYLTRLNWYYRIIGRPRFKRGIMGLDNIDWIVSTLDGLLETTDRYDTSKEKNA